MKQEIIFTYLMIAYFTYLLTDVTLLFLYLILYYELLLLLGGQATSIFLASLFDLMVVVQCIGLCGLYVSKVSQKKKLTDSCTYI